MIQERLLKFIYLRYRQYFYRFFEEEFLRDIPQDVHEPAMRFLANGKEKLEKWALFQAKFLQRRMVVDPDMIQVYTGMMLMMRLILRHIDSVKVQTVQHGHTEEEGEKKVDPIQEAQNAVEQMRQKNLSTQ